ncbi:MAG TPA: D-alanine--D-alanine ligase [Candidatus Paceibacterota bacterium]|nr:D-alanine--D-alanine ligase [Candidatus Paceibacterota bacterium]
MSFAHKTRVAVLRGGPSSEYDVSLKSGETVLKNLPQKYEGVDVFISKDGVWHVQGFEKTPADALKNVDVAFVALHGQYGEDGKVQRILEHIGIPYTGSESFPSAVAMNKHLAKGALAKIKDKVKMAAHKVFSREEVAQKGPHGIFREIILPSVVKPVSAGSSVGVSIVRTYFELEPAVVLALDHSDAIIIEEYIIGREATCGVLEDFRNERHYALLPIEIIHPESSEFFDYDAKYGGQSREICPGNFDEATKRAIQEAAIAIHRELGLRHYSRSDFIVHPKRGVYFLEANTLPGLTSESLLPKSVNAVGSSLPQFLDHVLTLALDRD